MAEAEQPSTAAVGGLSTSLLDSINAHRIATPAKDDKPEEAAKPSPRGSSSKKKKKTKTTPAKDADHQPAADQQPTSESDEAIEKPALPTDLLGMINARRIATPAKDDKPE